MEKDASYNMKRSEVIRNTMFAFLVISYFFSYFFRVSTSVVLPILQQEWGFSAALAGFISSMYFYTYAMMQPLCGMLNDKIGPTLVVGVGIIITSIGSIIFGLGNFPAALVVGRLLMGIGLSPMLSGLLVYQSTNFSTARYTSLSGLSMMVGNMGAVFSVAPLSLAIHHWGRLTVFSGLSLVTLTIAAVLLAYSLSRARAPHNGASFRSLLASQFRMAFSTVKASREIKLITMIWMVSFGALMSFQGLWAVSWFSAAYPRDAGLASLSATMIGIGVMAGNIIGGALGKAPSKRHRIVSACVYLTATMWVLVILCFWRQAPLALTVAAATFLGITNGVSFVQFTAAINDLAPVGQGGSVFGITNFFTFTCVILFQWGTGSLIGWFGHRMGSAEAYLSTFLIVTLSMVIPCVAATILAPFSRVAMPKA